MLRNRSVPVDTILPHVTYKYLQPAVDWLSSTFGFVEHYRYGEPLSGAQVRFGNAWLMLNSARGNELSHAELCYGTQSLTIFVEDVEAHFARCKAAAPGLWRICTRRNTASCSMGSSISKAIIGSSLVMCAT